MARAGERGFCKSSKNVYRQYSTEILRSWSSSTSFSILLTSHFEAFDPDFLQEQGVSRLLTVAEECEPPDSVRQFICGPDPLPAGAGQQINGRIEPSCCRLKWIALRESPYSVLPLKEVSCQSINRTTCPFLALNHRNRVNVQFTCLFACFCFPGNCVLGESPVAPHR